MSSRNSGASALELSSCAREPIRTPGAIQLWEATFRTLTDSWDATPAGAVDLRGVGAVRAWRVVRP